MIDDDKIKYSDIIEPDNSIEKLIAQLKDLNGQYETMVNAIRAGADRITYALKSASGATNEGRESIEKAAASTSRLERAQKELKFAISDTGKQIAWLKAQTSDANKSTVEQQRYIQQAVSSYDRLKSDLKDMVSLYKSLTAAERADSQMGQQLLNDIINLRGQIKALDEQMKPHIQTLTEVEKAEQRLAYLQSEEGQRLLEIKAKINELTSARHQQKASVDPLTQAQEKLAHAQSEENAQLKLYSIQIKEANRITQLQAQIANSAEGSYNRLSAQYELNKIKLNQMSAAERESINVGKKLEAETHAIYQQMIKLQEATGNYRLSVGHYQKTWDGLGISVSQVVRELPAAAVSMNTFFLGISNNIPLLVDEINRLRLQNKALQAEGKATVSVTKSLTKAFFSWNTVLVVLLTVLSMFGGKIIDFISNLKKGKKQALSFTDALDGIAEELKDTNASYGDNIVSLKRLRSEWKSLKSQAEKTKWIEDNSSKFNELGIAINNVNDADNAFINNTDSIIEALKLRAKAAAAQKLAAEEYEKALLKRNEAEKEALKGPSDEDKYSANVLKNLYMKAPDWEAKKELMATVATPEAQHKGRIERLKKEATVAEQAGDAYFNLADGYESAAAAALKAAGIKSGKKDKPDKSKPRDLTDIINRNSITAEKKYAESISKLQDDEYAKKRKMITNQIQDENNKLREMYRKNEEYVKNVDGKYKQLTEDQKKQIQQQQEWINSAISNNLEALQNQLDRIQREQQLNSLKISRETINNMDIGEASRVSSEDQNRIKKQPLVTTSISVTQNASEIEKSLAKERQLVEKHLKQEYNLIRRTNKKLRDLGDDSARSDEELLTEYNEKRIEIWAKYDKLILDIRKQNIEDQLSLVKKGTKEELELLLEQNEIARQAALSANAAKPANEQVSTSTINAQFNKSSNLIGGSWKMTQFDEQQELNEAIFNEVEHSEKEITRFKLTQEKERWLEQIRLAEDGALDWSQTQIDTAKSTVKGIERELSELNNFIGDIGEHGLVGGLLANLGFDDDAINAFNDAVNTVIEQLQNILSVETELAERAVENAEKRVEAAQKAYDAEIEARNNGYAHNAAAAKKELELEKKNQQEKQKELEKAQKRQEALNSVMQATSLVTASANLWSAMSSVPIIGPALAIAAIAAMWTSFAVAKVKAKQLTSQSEEYGDGGLEFLEGGSHASGNDIDLGVNNRNKRRMKAEGGEALAIINKKQTRKYRRLLPGIIDSFNKGTFEDKYLNAFANTGNINIWPMKNDATDLSKIESYVEEIKEQGKRYVSYDATGNKIVRHKNLTRIYIQS